MGGGGTGRPALGFAPAGGGGTGPRFTIAFLGPTAPNGLNLAGAGAGTAGAATGNAIFTGATAATGAFAGARAAIFARGAVFTGTTMGALGGEAAAGWASNMADEGTTERT